MLATMKRIAASVLLLFGAVVPSTAEISKSDKFDLAWKNAWEDFFSP